MSGYSCSSRTTSAALKKRFLTSSKTLNKQKSLEEELDNTEFDYQKNAALLENNKKTRECSISDTSTSEKPCAVGAENGSGISNVTLPKTSVATSAAEYLKNYSMLQKLRRAQEVSNKYS